MGRLVNAFVARFVGGPVASQRALIRKLRTSTKASIRVGFERVPAKWLRELLDVDAPQVFGQVACPTLIIGGEKDLQCDPVDVSRIAALAHGAVDHRVIAGMTHVLRCDDQPAALLSSGRLLAQPVEPELLELVAEWVRSRTVSDAAPRLTSGAEPDPPIQPAGSARGWWSSVNRSPATQGNFTSPRAR